MTSTKLLARLTASALFVSTFLPALPVRAETYTQATQLVIGSTTLTVMPGSQYDSLVTTSDGFTVTIGEGEAFVVRSPGGSPLALENDALLPACHVIRTLENQLFLVGPRTATVTIGTAGCSTAEAADDMTPFLTIQTPNGGDTYQAGQAVQVFWGSSGRTIPYVRLELSTDGGRTYPAVLADGDTNLGFFNWTVPTLQYNSRARLRLQGLDQGRIVALDISDADFVIQGTEGDAPTETPVTPPVHPPYDPAAATTAATTIDADRGFQPGLQLVGSTVCTAGTRIKGAGSSAVYYCGADAKRHAFPNQRIHDSWYVDFNGVVTLSDAELAAIPLGANVTYRPGVRLVKITTDPKVYAVAANGELRWVPDEWTARDLYGTDWNQKVDDIPDAFFGNDYRIGEQVPTVGS